MIETNKQLKESSLLIGKEVMTILNSFKKYI